MRTFLPVILILFVLLLAACGQKGPLYFPDEEEAALHEIRVG